ncbi:hypothetical protein [Thermus thermophilus]|uniref:hypothetical protein n=1 Tax=Thermus thermophilus TaxID=274 RepID=UPI003466A415
MAAAYWGKAEAILTFNLKDFPEEMLNRWELVALDPDGYLTELTEGLIRKNFLPQPLLRILERQRRSLRNPTLGTTAFLEGLKQAGLITFAEMLRAYEEYLKALLRLFRLSATLEIGGRYEWSSLRVYPFGGSG